MGYWHGYSTYICNVVGLWSDERFFKVGQRFVLCFISIVNIGWQGWQRRRVASVVWTGRNRRRSRHFIQRSLLGDSQCKSFIYLFTLEIPLMPTMQCDGKESPNRAPPTNAMNQRKYEKRERRFYYAFLLASKRLLCSAGPLFRHGIYRKVPFQLFIEFTIEYIQCVKMESELAYSPLLYLLIHIITNHKDQTNKSRFSLPRCSSFFPFLLTKP
jgi:hypothetical protein